MRLNERSLFNLDLLILKDENVKHLKPVTALNILESSSKNFESKGLYSTEIFGPIGSKLRNDSFAYIKLKTNVLHPLIYKHYCKLKMLYKDIMSGKKYARFDNEIKDFVLSNISDGDTGYAFFVNNMDNIKFDNRDSEQRKFRIAMVKKYGKKEDMFGNWAVMPAGMRDYSVDEAGKPSKDEVNDLYVKLLGVTNILLNTKLDPDMEFTIDTVKISIQNVLLEIFEHFRTLLDGKNKFIQGKWAKRGVSHGTRNVLTPPLNNIKDLDSSNNITLEHTVVGLYQYIRAITPITMNRLHTIFINRILTQTTTQASLINPKTMKSELVEIPVKKRDEWLSLEGLDDVIGKLEQEAIRKEPVMLNGYYMALIHEKDNELMVVFNTDHIPEDYDTKYLRPITYIEMMYIAIYDIKDKYPACVTRFPVINLGSIFPSKVFVKVTNNSRTVNMSILGQVTKMLNYPILDDTFFNSLAVPSCYLAVLGGDYDGDVVSFNVLYSEESIKEIEDIVKQKSYYIKPDGELAFSPVTKTLTYVVKTMADKQVKIYE